MIRAFICSWLALLSAHAGTLAIFETQVGTNPPSNMYLELYDADKPVTVRNFIRYVESGRFDNMIVHRWDPKFVIQGGGYYIDPEIDYFRPVQTFGTITNEYSVGRTISNTYGTIAMARSSEVHSASSQWFINLTNNAFLDTVNEGFTVFGKVIKGTNVLDVFHPEPVDNTLKIYQICANLCRSPVANSLGEPVFMPELPGWGNQATLEDLVRVNVRFVEANIAILPSGAREISWNSVAGVSNRVEVNNGITGEWTTLSEGRGSGGIMKSTDSSPQHEGQNYRIRIILN